jgi:hypothetical protein
MDFTKLKQQLDQAKKTATPRTVILWGHEDLLGEAVESILTADKNWQVIKVLGNPDVAALAREVQDLKPEIVIINRGPCEEIFPPLLQIIENLPEVKIITVNPDNNLVEVYNKQKVRIEEVSDLLSVIDKNSKSIIEGGEDIS